MGRDRARVGGGIQSGKAGDRPGKAPNKFVAPWAVRPAIVLGCWPGFACAMGFHRAAQGSIEVDRDP